MNYRVSIPIFRSPTKDVDMTEQFARTDGTKDADIRRLYEEANAKQECPFDHLDPEINRPVFGQHQHWNVWYHPKPVKGSSTHIMLATKQHLRYLHELSEPAVAEFVMLCRMLQGDFGDCYSLVCRAGGTPEANYNATTIYHLHWHFVVSDGRPVDASDIDPAIRMVYENVKRIAPEGTDPLEFIDDVRELFDALRAAEKGTAYPIRFKLSNMVRRP